MSDFLTPFLTISLSLLSGLAAAWLFSKVLDIREKLRVKNPQVMQIVEAAARFAVTAAEQAQKAGFIGDRKAYALRIAEDYLDEHGVVIDVDLLVAAIESAVWNEFNAAKEAAKVQSRVFDRGFLDDDDD